MKKYCRPFDNELLILFLGLVQVGFRSMNIIMDAFSSSNRVWVWADSSAVWDFKPEDLTGLAPYFSFQRCLAKTCQVFYERGQVG